jgi:hypothetical protein
VSDSRRSFRLPGSPEASDSRIFLTKISLAAKTSSNATPLSGEGERM